MMTKRITPDQARALATLVVAMRTDGEPWDAQGVYVAIGKAATRGTADEVIHAALAAAATATNRTPAVIAMDGPHWQRTTRGRDEHRFARCPVIGHSSYLASNCGACMTDAAESAGEAIREQAAPDPDQIERNARWARKIQADRARRKEPP